VAIVQEIGEPPASPPDPELLHAPPDPEVLRVITDQLSPQVLSQLTPQQRAELLHQVYVEMNQMLKQPDASYPSFRGIRSS
jgi:hypothetical protein